MKNFLLLIPFILLFGCVKNQVPEDVIPPEQMTSILIDIYISEAKVKVLSINHDSAGKLFQAFEQQVYEKHHIDSSTYTKSYEYYLNNLEAMEKIYAAVIDSLSLRERLVESE